MTKELACTSYSTASTSTISCTCKKKCCFDIMWKTIKDYLVTFFSNGNYSGQGKAVVPAAAPLSLEMFTMLVIAVDICSFVIAAFTA